MIEETSFEIGDLAKFLVDLDVSPAGEWVGVTDFSDNDQSIYFGDRKIKLPEKVRFPLVRSLDEETVLIVNTRAGLNEDNARIITASGETKAVFPVNDAIENVIITKDFIVVTQFDEAAIGGDGVCVYDFRGNRRFNYHEAFGVEAVEIFDCYAAALVGENRIIFCPYTEFPMVLFDIDEKSQQIWEIPQAACGFHAITKRGDEFYFHRVYRLKLEGYDFGIYKWKIGNKDVEKVGEYSSHFTRGLPGGKFLARNESGYAIVSVT